MGNVAISITRQFGSLGRPIAKRMAELLNINFYDRDIVEAAAEKLDLPLKLVSDQEEIASKGFLKMKYPLGKGNSDIQDRIFYAQSKIILDIAEKESCIIVGRCSDYILEAMPNHLSIYIYAPKNQRLLNCIHTLDMEEKNAQKMIHDVDKARELYHQRYAHYSSEDCNHMDLMINSSLLGVEGTAQYLVDFIKRKYGQEI